MKTVYINEEGWLMSPGFPNCKIELEVSDELEEELSIGKVGYNWKYDFETKKFSMILLDTDQNLKILRQIQCFDIIDNRSPMWYQRLTHEQTQELNNWYQAWLDVTETHIIPVKPEWL